MTSLRKLGYPAKSNIFKNKLKFRKLLIKSFQRRFRPELINGKIDQECMLIINKLTSIRSKNLLEIIKLMNILS